MIGHVVACWFVVQAFEKTSDASVSTDPDGGRSTGADLEG
jgi:hypothetical protein